MNPQRSRGVAVSGDRLMEALPLPACRHARPVRSCSVCYGHAKVMLHAHGEVNYPCGPSGSKCVVARSESADAAVMQW